MHDSSSETSKTTVTLSSVSSTSRSTVEPYFQLSGSIVFSLIGLDAVWNDPEVAEQVLNSVGLTIAQVVGMPVSYVTVWFAQSRRLPATARELSGETVEVAYGIAAPAGSAPGAVAAGASLRGVGVDLFTSLLQGNVDSVLGEGTLSVAVLEVTADAADAPHDPPDDSLDLPDEAQASSEGLAAALLVLGCCLGSSCLVLAVLSLRRRRRVLRGERARAQKERTPPEVEVEAEPHEEGRLPPRAQTVLQVELTEDEGPRLIGRPPRGRSPAPGASRWRSPSGSASSRSASSEAPVAQRVRALRSPWRSPSGGASARSSEAPRPASGERGRRTGGHARPLVTQRVRALPQPHIRSPGMARPRREASDEFDFTYLDIPQERPRPVRRWGAGPPGAAVAAAPAAVRHRPARGRGAPREGSDGLQFVFVDLAAPDELPDEYRQEPAPGSRTSSPQRRPRDHRGDGQGSPGASGPDLWRHDRCKSSQKYFVVV